MLNSTKENAFGCPASGEGAYRDGRKVPKWLDSKYEAPNVTRPAFTKIIADIVVT